MRLTYGEQLRRARHRAGWSLHRLADFLGTTEAQLSRVETGVRPPFDERITFQAADALGVGRWGLAAAAVAHAGWTDTARLLERAVAGHDEPYQTGKGMDIDAEA